MNGIPSFEQKVLPFHFPFQLSSPSWLLLKETEQEQTVSDQLLSLLGIDVPPQPRYHSVTITHPYTCLPLTFSTSCRRRGFLTFMTRSSLFLPHRLSIALFFSCHPLGSHTLKWKWKVPLSEIITSSALSSPPPLPSFISASTCLALSYYQNLEQWALQDCHESVLVWYMAWIKTLSYLSFLFV